MDLPTNGQFYGTLAHHIILKRVSCEKQNEVWFLVEGKPLRFSLNEFVLISGLNTSDGTNATEIEKVMQNSRLQKKYFNNGPIKLKDIVRVLDELSKKNDRTRD